jgi:hypothetical protein
VATVVFLITDKSIALPTGSWSVFTDHRSTPQAGAVRPDVPATANPAVKAAVSAATASVVRASTRYVTTKEVRSVPTEPHLTTIGHRPAVVRVPTFHVQLTRRWAFVCFEYNPAAWDGPLL